MLGERFFSIFCLLLISCTLVSAGEGKSFFKNEDDKDKKLQSFEGGGGGDREAKRSHSMGARFIDEIMAMQFEMGDRFTGGLPDTMLSMARHCIEFIPKGIAAVGFSQVKWPHKLTLKAMVFLIALGAMKANAVFCLNPISMGRFIAMAKVVNSVNDELVKIRDEFAGRILNAAFKADSAEEKTKQYCCSWFTYKKKAQEAVPEDVKEFVRSMLDTFFGLCQSLMCLEITPENWEESCAHIVFIDDEPLYPLPRSMHLASIYFGEQFI